MPEPHRSNPRPTIGSLIVIAAVVGGGAAAFAYTAGWLSPHRLTPEKMANLFHEPGDTHGHRLNHAKGICFTGTFESNGNGAELSKAQVFAAGRYPLLGRFNLGTPNPSVVDGTARVRGISISITTPDGQDWRSAMITAPVFPVSTPQAFYGLLTASASKDPKAMPAFAAAHPEIAGFGGWAKSAPWTGSYAEERYNGLNAFLFTDKNGNTHPVRWSINPDAQPVPVPADEIAKKPRDFLEQEIQQRVAAGPARWSMVVQVANPGDPTADPSKAWPQDRRTITVGTLVVDKVEPEPDGPCRDINFDPTVLPAGISTSDDPFPAARSAVYSVSFNRRTASASQYPRTDAGATP